MPMGINLLAGAVTTDEPTLVWWWVQLWSKLATALAMVNLPTLMPKPESLFDSWDEYLNGPGVGEKACKTFPTD
jgi:hypothetical protein